MVTYQLKNNPKVIHQSYVSKNSVPKVYHRKIMFKTFEVYQKPFHSHDWQRRSRSLPCQFPSQKFRRKLKFNPTHLPTKISGKPHSPGWNETSFFQNPKDLQFFSFEDPFCALDLSRMKKMPRFLEVFLKQIPFGFTSWYRSRWTRVRLPWRCQNDDDLKRF